MDKRLLEKEMVTEASQELDKALQLRPDDSQLQLTKARVLLRTGQPRKAMDLLNKFSENSVLAGKVKTLKGWALVAMNQWDRAIAILEAAVTLNPDPSEAQYFLGVAYQQTGQLAKAAKAFRTYFEATDTGRKIALSSKSAATQPLTRPAKSKATTPPSK